MAYGSQRCHRILNAWQQAMIYGVTTLAHVVRPIAIYLNLLLESRRTLRYGHWDCRILRTPVPEIDYDLSGVLIFLIQ